MAFKNEIKCEAEVIKNKFSWWRLVRLIFLFDWVDYIINNAANLNVVFLKVPNVNKVLRITTQDSIKVGTKVKIAYNPENLKQCRFLEYHS